MFERPITATEVVAVSGSTGAVHTHCELLREVRREAGDWRLRVPPPSHGRPLGEGKQRLVFNIHFLLAQLLKSTHFQRLDNLWLPSPGTEFWDLVILLLVRWYSKQAAPRVAGSIHTMSQIMINVVFLIQGPPF